VLQLARKLKSGNAPGIGKGEGEALFRHACAMNLEGIVSKRLEAPYRSGLSQAQLEQS
jgi:ATP-dependent DNA ligase